MRERSERLDIVCQGHTCLPGQIVEGRHGGVRNPQAEGLIYRRKRVTVRPTVRAREVAGPRIHGGGGRSVAMPLLPMTLLAVGGEQTLSLRKQLRR